LIYFLSLLNFNNNNNNNNCNRFWPRWFCRTFRYWTNIGIDN